MVHSISFYLFMSADIIDCYLQLKEIQNIESENTIFCMNIKACIIQLSKSPDECSET